MSRRAKAVFFGSMILSGFTIWGVHFLQEWEHNKMYEGVLRDEERRREKERQRLADSDVSFAGANHLLESTQDVHGNSNKLDIPYDSDSRNNEKMHS